jgi:hypothetical protein
MTAIRGEAFVVIGVAVVLALAEVGRRLQSERRDPIPNLLPAPTRPDPLAAFVTPHTPDAYEIAPRETRSR